MIQSSRSKRGTVGIVVVSAFLFGCFLSTTVVLNFVVHDTSNPNNVPDSAPHRVMYMNNEDGTSFNNNDRPLLVKPSIPQSSSSPSPLQGLRILIAIAAFDFSQIPHLEEVLDAYQGLCVTGAAKVDVVIHATVAYPVALIDLWNARLLNSCRGGVFSLQIVLQPSSLRLHLVDCHRDLFYARLEDYDLFIYTEDDIRVTPATVGAYVTETKRVQDLVGKERSMNFNVGIVRYEYNWPNNVIIDDKTRHATQNVTRVYWEHGRVRRTACLWVRGNYV